MLREGLRLAARLKTMASLHRRCSGDHCGMLCRTMVTRRGPFLKGAKVGPRPAGTPPALVVNSTAAVLCVLIGKRPGGICDPVLRFGDGGVVRDGGRSDVITRVMHDHVLCGPCLDGVGTTQLLTPFRVPYARGLGTFLGHATSPPRATKWGGTASCPRFKFIATDNV
jgi:hypothetical protein